MSIASLTVDLTANLSKFEADMGKGAQIAVREAEKMARAQTTFLRSLERTSERLGKTEADFLRVRAAELNASEAAEKFIARVEEVGGASARAGAAGAAGFQSISQAVDGVASRQRTTIAELISGIRQVTAEAARLRAAAIADEKAGVISPDQLKSRLGNVNAGQSDAIRRLKDAAAEEDAANKVADAEAAILAKRAAAFQQLQATVSRLAYQDVQKQIAAADAVAAAEAAVIAKRSVAFEKLRSDVSRMAYEEEQTQVAAARRTAEEEAAVVNKRVEAFQRLRDAVAKQNYNEQAAATKRASEAAAAAAASNDKWIASLDRAYNSMTKTRSELFAMEAAERGLTERAAPMIAKLAEAERNIGKFGIAAAGAGAKSKITQYEIQTLHYTVSDVVASLASGISPLTILLQQGGQVRDVFGSFGAVFQKVGQLLTPFRVGVGAAAAAVGALAYAMYEGAQQSRAFADAMTLTGDFAGQTEGQFNSLVKTIASTGEVSASAAREFAQALVATGEVGPKVFAAAAEAAARYGQATGKNAKEVASDFAAMSQGVEKWASEHNKQLNFVTAAQLRHIRELEEQGKTVEAQAAVYDLLNERLHKLEPNLGTLDRAIRATTNFWHGFWDAAFDVGRAETIEDKIARARAAASSAVGGERVSQTQLDPERRAQLAALRGSGTVGNEIATENLRLLLRSQSAAQVTKQANAELDQLNKDAAKSD
jgi:hypothetical protein